MRTFFMSNDQLITLSNLKIGHGVSYAIFHKLDDDLGIEFVRGVLPFWLVSDEFLAETNCGANGISSVFENGFSLFDEVHFERICTESPSDGTSLFVCLAPDMLDSYILAIDYFKEE